MWINDKKINFAVVLYENGLIVEYEDVPVMNGLGDSTIWRCTFENGSVLEIEFMPEEFRTIYNNVKH